MKTPKKPPQTSSNVFSKFTFLTRKNLRRLLLVIIFILALIGVGFITLFSYQKRYYDNQYPDAYPNYRLLKNPIWDRLRITYGITEANGCGSGGGSKPVCDEKYYKTRTRIETLKRLWLKRMFATSEEKKTGIVGWNNPLEGKKVITIDENFTGSLTITGGLLNVDDKFYTIQNSNYILSSGDETTTTIIGEQYKVLQITTKNAFDGGHIRNHYYNPNYTRIGDPEMVVWGWMFGEIAFNRIAKQSSGETCMIITKRNMIDETLLNTFPDHCEFYITPTISGYPQHLIELVFFRKSGTDNRPEIVLTPHTIQNYY